MSVLALCLIAAPPPVRATSSIDSLPVTQVIEALKSEIAIARLARSPADARFQIETVDVELTAIAKTEAGGGISLEVPIVKEAVGGGAVEAATQLTSTQKISLTLKPDGAFEDVSGAGSLGLAPAIQSVKAAIREAAQPPFKFTLDRFVFEAEFVIARSAEGSVKFLFLEGEAGGASTAKQRVTVHMVLGE